MITVYINSATNLLKQSIAITKAKRLQNRAFLSTTLPVKELYKITKLSQDHLAIDFTDKSKDGVHLNASISLLFKSMLFIDFKDKSLYRSNDGILDINHVREIILPLKNKYNVKEIYIDNFHKLSCNLMGRRHLYIGDKASMFYWRERENEYKMALLYYMSKKFEIDFIIGFELVKGVSSPTKISDIKFMDFGNTYDMVDKIVAYSSNQKEIILK